MLQGDCNIIEHSNSGRVTVIDVCNADSDDVYENAELRRAIYEDVSDNTTGNYGQKKYPENPIRYLEKLKIESIWRFIVSHPDMDHLDGIRDLFNDLTVCNVWDTANTKEILEFGNRSRFNKYDWDFYKALRSETAEGYRFFKLYADKNNPGNYWTEDYLKILCPTKDLVGRANKNTGDYNDSSYVILFTPPIGNTGNFWKILFCGDSHDDSWEYILANFKNEVSDVDVLIAPHHGRDSDRNYDFVRIVNPRITLFGNASRKHLAYSKYSSLKLTNNQAGSIVVKCTDRLYFYVKNQKFRDDWWHERGWGTAPDADARLGAYFTFSLPPK
ncbi:MAG: MBL fold metallo-hydrolase [Bacteroidia bacterium]|nr:MBL fold metallo-hydrolase [Bacteroidia bacterium]